MLVVLFMELVSADVALMGALAIVVAAGVLPLEDALIGFANPTLIALGSLYVVAAALRNSGALALAGTHLLGQVQSTRRLVARLVVPVSIGSAFLNNTPIVAMGIPAIQTWAQERDLSASKLLIPLSYASIFGGMCTLMGTSTNLVGHGLLQSHGMPGLGFFELAAVGIPCTLVGWLYLVFVAPELIVEREAALERGAVDDRVEHHGTGEAGREAHTVVVREGSRLVGEKVGEAELLERFNAVVEEVRRGGEHVEGDLSEIALEAGDTLVLDTGGGFRKAFEDSPEFYVTSAYEEGGQEQAAAQTVGQRFGMWSTLAVLVAIVAASAAGLVHIATAALVGAVLLVVTDVISTARARDAIDWQVLLVIGAALGLGEAMEASGAAELLGRGIVETGQAMGPVGLLAALVFGTSVLTNMITNNGAVALFFPVALSVSESMGIDARPLVIGITVAGSMAMATPLGYQTNLMVYSAGNYHFADFLKVGMPLQLLLLVVSVAVIPLVWAF